MSNIRPLSKTKFGLFSDLHLGKHANNAKWHNIADEWADWAVAELKRNNIKDVIFGGDWHDDRDEISTYTLDASAKILSKFSDFHVYMIVGNHDIPHRVDTTVSSVSIYGDRSNVTIVDSVSEIEAFDKRITLVPWASDIQSIQKSDIIIGHLEINTFKMSSHAVCEGGMNPIDLLDRSSLIFSGHFHQRSQKKYSSGEIIYVGNPFEMDYGDENDQKGLYIVDLDDNSYQFINNTVSPNHKTLRLSNIIHCSVEDLRNKVTDNLVKLVFDVPINDKDSMYLVERLSSWKPRTLLTEYTFVTDSIEVENELDASDFVDNRTSIISFVDSLNVTNKEQVQVYLLNLYDKYA